MRLGYVLFIGSCFLIMMTGIVIGINLTILMESNPEYDASWGKVAFASFWAIFFSMSAFRNSSKTTLKNLQASLIENYREAEPDPVMWLNHRISSEIWKRT